MQGLVDIVCFSWQPARPRNCAGNIIDGPQDERGQVLFAVGVVGASTAGKVDRTRKGSTNGVDPFGVFVKGFDQSKIDQDDAVLWL